MPSNDRIIVGIDVGTHKVCTIVAEAALGPGSRLNVLGVGAVAAEGMSKGMITDIVAASRAVEHSLEAAERQSGCRILSAYVSVSGSHISSLNNRGLVAVSNPDRIITQEDVARAIEAASAVVTPTGRDMLHVIPRAYTVDGQEGIRNPAGMSGFRLDVETHIVTAAGNVRENLIRCVQKADVEVDDLVFSPLASAEAVLTEQEKNLGVVLLDIGHGTTDIAIYADGSVWHTRVLPIGGWHLTNDLVYVFNIPYEAAETLKMQYGHAAVPGTNLYAAAPAKQPVNGKSHPVGAHVSREVVGNGYAGSIALNHLNGSGDHGDHEERSGHDAEEGEQEPAAPVPGEEMLEARTFEDTTRLISRGELNAVMAARFEQLFTMVGDEIRRSGYEGLLPAGVVLTGGVANMGGVEQVASHFLRMPVRTGKPQKVGGLADAFDSPEYATTVGLTLWGLKQGTSPTTTAHPRSSTPSKPEEGLGLFAKWLRSFLPKD